MSSEKELIKKGPHKPSDSKRIKNTYLDKSDKDSEDKPKLSAMIFDESIDEGIGDYFKAFWQGLTGETYGELSSYIDPNIDPKFKVFIKAMREPLTIQEEWMVNNRVMTEKEIMKYREMKVFNMLYAQDIKNMAPHVLPGAKEKLNYFVQVLPAFKAKYDAGVDAAERALGIDDYRHKRRHYPGRVIATSDGGKEKINPETGEVESYKASTERKRNTLLSRLRNIKEGLEQALDEIQKNDIKIQERRKIKIAQFVDEANKIEAEITSLSEEEFEKALPVKLGTVYKKGPWRHFIDVAANELTRIKHFLANN